MNKKEDLIFREEQRFSLWLRLPLVALMAVVVALEYFALKQLAAKEGPPEMLPIISLVVAGIILPIVIAPLFLTLKLENGGPLRWPVCAIFPVSYSLQEVHSGRFEPVPNQAIQTYT